jgi:hypothetical protein
VTTSVRSVWKRSGPADRALLREEYWIPGALYRKRVGDD